MTSLDPPSPSPRRRRWLRVSLRGLMVLVVVVSVPAAWVANTIQTQRRAIAAVQAAGGTIGYHHRHQLSQEPSAPAWLRRWLGDELFQNVNSVYFFNNPDHPFSADALAVIAKFDRLENLGIFDLPGTGDGFHHLGGLEHLKYLDLSGSGITNATLAEIARIRSIEILEMKKSEATDEGFASLAALASLKDLSITRCPNLTDSGAARMVEGMPRLRSLILTDGPKSLAATLATLARVHPDLVHLDISGTGATDDDLKAVAKLAKLEILFMDNTRITDEGLKHLSGLDSLRRLHLNSTKVTDAGLIHLEKLPLVGLDLGGSLVTDAGMPTVARIITLRALGLARLPRLTDAGLVPLAPLRGVDYLDVSENQVTAEGAAVLQQAVPGFGQVITLPPTIPILGTPF